MNRDLTEGKPFRVLWLYCLPLLGSILFQQFYNIADSLVAGRFLGENALAAVGNASEITLIYTAFAFGSNIGCSVVISNLFGGKKYGELKSSVSTAFITFGVLCVLLMAFGFVFTKPILLAMNTPEGEVLDGSFLYLMLYTAGIPFFFFYNVATGIFSAMGDSRTPFYFLMGSSLSNIAADILLVTVIPMGIAGVAVATIFCQGVSCILSVLFLFLRLRAISHEGKIETFSPTIFRKIVKVAVPSILQQGSISVGNIFIQGIVNGFGPSVMAGFTAAIKLNSIATSCFTANANGLSSYTAQNLGRGKSERISPGLKAGYALNALVAVLLCVLFTAGGTACVSLFMTESSETALETGKQFLLIVSPFYLVCSLKITADGVLRGAGAMSLFMIATFTDLIVRVALSYALSVPLGCLGIWLSWPIGWLLGAAVSVFFYAKGTWKRAKL